MKRTQAGLVILIAAILANIAIYAARPLGEAFFILGDTMVIAFSLTAFAMGLYASRLHGLKSAQGKAIFLISMGIFFWFLGELLWSIYEIALGIEAPVLSFADLAWLAGYPFFVAGLYYVRKTAGTPLMKRKISVERTSFALLSAVIILYIIAPLLAMDAGVLEKAVSLSYVIGDAILLAACIMVVVSLMWGRFSSPWLMITLAITLASLADLFYSFILGSYETGNWIDLLWNADYMLVGYAFFYYRSSVKEFIKNAGTRK
jgi:hypothetical protein